MAAGIFTSGVLLTRLISSGSGAKAVLIAMAAALILIALDLRDEHVV
jgi:hypothetical protein